MTQTKPVKMFGIHQAVFISLATGLPLSKPLYMMGDCAVSMEAEEATIKGGSSKFIQGSEVTAVNVNVSLNIKEMEYNAVALMLGAQEVVELNAAEASGWVGGLAGADDTGVENEVTDWQGSTMDDGDTGIASAEIEAAGDVGDLKSGIYVVKQVTDATHVDVYCYTDLEFARKSTDDALAFEDDTNKITATALEITTGTAVSIPNTGLTITGGSGTIALGTDGNTCAFRVRSPNDGNMIIPIGKDPIDFKKFGLVLYSALQGDKSYAEIYLRKVHAAGFPYMLPEGNYGTSDVAFTVERDGNMGIGEIRYTKGKYFDI